jgi:hypothetical protein
VSLLQGCDALNGGLEGCMGRPCMHARRLKGPQGAFKGTPLLLYVLGSLSVHSLGGISARFTTITISGEVRCPGSWSGAGYIPL